MSLVVSNRHQLGQSPIETNNFTLDATAANGTMKLVRGVAGAGTQDIMTISALGEIDFPQMIRSYGPNGYQKLNGGLIVQWGSVADGTPDATDVPLPIAFPNALLEVIPTIRASLVNTSLVSCYWDAALSSLTKIRVGRRYVNNGGAVGLASQGYQYIALGY